MVQIAFDSSKIFLSKLIFATAFESGDTTTACFTQFQTSFPAKTAPEKKKLMIFQGPFDVSIFKAKDH